MPLKAGDRLGPYEIVEPVGAGGMGEVYRAVDTRLQRVVAVKILKAGTGPDLERQSRFLREARAASALKHPGIVTIFDIGAPQMGVLLLSSNRPPITPSGRRTAASSSTVRPTKREWKPSRRK